MTNIDRSFSIRYFLLPTRLRYNPIVMLTYFLLIITIIGLIGLGFMVYTLSQSLKHMQDSQNNDKGLIMINDNMKGMTEALNHRLSEAAKYMADVKREVGVVEERFRRFEEFNDLLHPKLRGIIGERILEEAIADSIPNNLYETQYRFKNGETVDAMIRTKAGIIPIDSKFPLENFRQISAAENDDMKNRASKDFAKAVKKHVDDICKKYILPEEGTVNFSIMYVPSENIYYQIMIDEENNVMEYAKSKNVLVTSPNGFHFMMRVVLMSLERDRMQEQTMKIWEILKGVEQETARFRNDLDLVSKHITNAKGAIDAAYKGYDRLYNKVEQVKLLE